MAIDYILLKSSESVFHEKFVSAEEGKYLSFDSNLDPILTTVSTASYSLTGLTSSYSNTSTSASYAITALSSSYALTSSYVNLGYTPENSANKENTTLDTSIIKYPTVNLLKTVNDSRKYYHGIESAGSLSFNQSTHVLTIQSGSNIYWNQGSKYTTATTISCDVDSYETLTINTLYYFYFDDTSGTLKASDSPWNFRLHTFVATMFWNGSTGSVQEETHNHTRDIDWHEWAHDTIGCRYESGLSLTNPTTTNDALLQIESGNIHDEDIDFGISQQTVIRGWYKVSASIYTFKDYSLPYIGTTSQPQWLDTNDYTLKNVAANGFVVMWVYASLDIDKPIYVIPTHASTAYTTIGAARSESPPNLSSLNLNAEMKLIYKFIYKGDGNFQESVDYRSSSPLPGGGSTSTTAAAVSFAPAGSLSSTTVQSVLEELDSEKAAVDQTFYIGTTQVAINRSSAALVLTGITSIDGSAATATSASYATTSSYSTLAVTSNTSTSASYATTSSWAGNTKLNIGRDLTESGSLVLGDANTWMTFNNASARNITIPKNTFAAADVIYLRQKGNGAMMMIPQDGTITLVGKTTSSGANTIVGVFFETTNLAAIVGGTT